MKLQMFKKGQTKLIKLKLVREAIFYRTDKVLYIRRLPRLTKTFAYKMQAPCQAPSTYSNIINMLVETIRKAGDCHQPSKKTSFHPHLAESSF